MENLEYIKSSSNLEFFANQIVEGFITGLHKSPYHGFSVEFAEHRLYNTGESTRHIDWKLYGRTDKLFVKRYQEETNLRCQLILDSSSSMYYPKFKSPSLENPNKLLFSIYSSAVLMNLLKRQRDAVGISVFSDAIETHTPNKTTLRHHKLLYHELENLLNRDALKNKRKTNASSSLHQISDMLNKRSMVMVFTDMINELEDLEAQFEPYKHLKYNKHEVVLFLLYEPKTELFLEFDNRPYNFIDSESGSQIKLNPKQIQENYKKKTSKYINELRLKCLKYKIDLVEVDINQGFDHILTSYLLKRQKMF